MIEIPEADFYDCSDSETLHHTSPEEAVEEYLDGFFTPGCNPADVIKSCCPITVTLCNRAKLPANEAAQTADWLLGQLSDHWADSDWANPDGDDDMPALEAARQHMEAAVKAYHANMEVWSCERVKDVVLDVEQVTAMMRKHCPDWFETP